MTLFGRQQQLLQLTELVGSRKNVMLYGPAGIGKTRLLNAIAPAIPLLVHLSECSTVQNLIRRLAFSLWSENIGDLKDRFRSFEQLRAKSSVSLKGICLSALKERNCTLLLEHTGFTSQQFASAIKYLMSEAKVSLIFATRSIHMEDGGYVVRLFPDRTERLELRNFDYATASRFAQAYAGELDLRSGNVTEFLHTVVELSEGNPGAITTMIQMALLPAYRSGSCIKTTLIYVDFRMHHGAAR